MDANRLPLDVPGMEEHFGRVEVVRSARRKKTISAEIVGDTLVVSIPQRLSRAEEHEWVNRMAARMSERRRRDRLNHDGALRRRAAELSDLYLDGVRPKGISWVETQRSRWGSCSGSGALSFNWRLVLAPEPVLDYVVWHEACHLRVPDHSPRFWALVESHCPGYREARRWLGRHGPTLAL